MALLQIIFEVGHWSDLPQNLNLIARRNREANGVSHKEVCVTTCVACV
jgi:hypothetical protein